MALHNHHLTRLPGFKIRARHELIAPAIGVLPQETKAYNRVTLLMWGLPPAITLLSLLDLGLFFLYQKKFHFWIGILEDAQGGIDMDRDYDDDDEEQEVFGENDQEVGETNTEKVGLQYTDILLLRTMKHWNARL